MEFLSAPWWSALLAIILIDLVLAGDNAIVIALASRNLPAALQKKAIFWGTVGAIAVRSVMTLGVVWLLQIPGLMLVGGLGLLWIAYKLIAEGSIEEKILQLQDLKKELFDNIISADGASLKSLSEDDIKMLLAK